MRVFVYATVHHLAERLDQRTGGWYKPELAILLQAGVSHPTIDAMITEEGIVRHVNLRNDRAWTEVIDQAAE